MLTSQSELSKSVAARLAEVNERIAHYRTDPTGLTIVAVTKGHGPEAVLAAQDCGLFDIGENYADELVAKCEALGRPAGLRWHFQGRLQTNKINKLREVVDVWQSLDSADRLVALAKRQPGAQVFIQIDSTGGQTGRSGAAIDSAKDLVLQGIDLGLDVRGLMTVAPLAEHGCGSAFQSFTAVAELSRRLGLAEVSMGMSDDFEDAIKAGSTMIRLGSVLFGIRR